MLYLDEYKPDAEAAELLEKFRENCSMHWLTCEVLLAIRGWSGSGGALVSMAKVYSRFWPIFYAYSSIAPEGILLSLQTCGAVEYSFKTEGLAADAGDAQLNLQQSLSHWVQTGSCQADVRPTALVKSLRDAIGFSLSATRNLNVPGAEVIVSALPDAQNTRSADVAILMPFKGKRRPIYEKSIRPACDAVGLSCMRADEYYGSKHVMSEIVSLIKNARIVISDISELNPNVLYETGIAHALGGRVLLIAERGTNVPFDVQDRRRLEYSVWFGGRKKLSGDIKSTLIDMLNLFEPRINGG